MRRSGSGVCVASSVLCAGSGRLLVGWVIVGYEGDHLVGGEAVSAAQVGELYEEGDAGHGGAGVLDELAHSTGGAARGEQVVGDEDLGAGRYGVGVGLERVGAVLELVGRGDRLAGKLVGLARQDEALARPVGHGGAEDEAAGLGREDAVVVEAVGGEREGVDGGVEGLAVLYEGGNVLERDPGVGEVRDGSDAALKVADYLLHPVHAGSQGTKVSITDRKSVV